MIVFIVGTARSGTCWLGRILKSHPQITGSVEEEPRFSMVTEAAIYPERRAEILQELLPLYAAKEHVYRNYSEKAHPALWLVEDLAAAIPSARFIAIERDEEAVVSSMMKHEGVRRRCEDGWYEYPEPCPFMGLNTKESYSRLSVESRCVLRWRAHREEVTRLQPIMGRRMCVLDYSELVEGQASTLEFVRKWLGLSRRFPEGVK